MAVQRRTLADLFPGNQVAYQPSLVDQYSQQFSDVPYLANKFQYIQNQRDMFSPTEDNIVGLYNQFIEQQNPYYQRLVDVNSKLNQDNIGRINELRTNVYNQYGPQGEQQKQLQDYYDNLAKYYATTAGNEKARINADTVGTGASIGQGRNARSDLETKLIQNALSIQDKKFRDYQNVYNTFNKYLQDIQGAYANSNDRYVKSVYDDITQQQQALGSNLFNNLQNIEAQRAQWAMQQALKSSVPVRQPAAYTSTGANKNMSVAPNFPVTNNVGGYVNMSPQEQAVYDAYTQNRLTPATVSVQGNGLNQVVRNTSDLNQLIPQRKQRVIVGQNADGSYIYQ